MINPKELFNVEEEFKKIESEIDKRIVKNFRYDTAVSQFDMCMSLCLAEYIAKKYSEVGWNVEVLKCPNTSIWVRFIFTL